MVENALRFAATNGNMAEVAKLLAEGADVNTKDGRGWTPLHWASINGNAEVVKALLAKGAGANVTNNNGETPLHWASYNGHTKVVKMLLANGANTNVKNNYGKTALDLASKNGHTEVVKMLLAKGGDANVKNNYGNTPLHRASYNGHTEVVKMLLAKGAIVNSKDDLRWTPLHRASENGHTKVVKMLLANGANTNVKNNYGKTALDIAKSKGIKSIIKLIENAPDERLARNVQNSPNASATRQVHVSTEDDASMIKLSKNAHVEQITPAVQNSSTINRALHDAAKNGNTAEVVMVLAEGADINFTDNYGLTPLHWASAHVHIEVTKTLLAKGGDVNSKDGYGETPLHRASDNGHIEVAKALLAGEDVNANSKNNGGLTPLHRASDNGHTEVVKMLLAKGAYVNNKDNHGETPLHWASDNGHTEVVKLLLAEGADVNCKNVIGWTPLHRASDNRHTEVVKMLLAKGADFNSKDNHGLTPLYRASYNGHTEVVKMLLAKGADFNSKDNNGLTPLYRASYNGHTVVVKMLLAKGADPNVKNNIGKTPLYLAIIKGDMDVVEALIVYGASCDAKSQDGKTALDIAKSKGVVSIIKLLENAHVEQMAPDVQNYPIATTTSQVHVLTDDDVLFLKKARDGGDIPVISEVERSALQTLTTNMVHFENSLESVRELPSSLANKDSQVANYFFCFTSAFERTYTVAQVLNSGAVGVQSFEDHGMIEALLGGASWVAEKSNLPFVGCISIFSTIIVHQRDKRNHNLFAAFEDFFSGNCRDQYLLTYRKLAEQFCLQLDISSLTENREGTIGKLKSQVNNKIIDPIRKHLRKVHLDTILRLNPVEEKAMSDLASITEEVLRLHQEEHHTYDHLRTSNKSVIASYFVERVFGVQSISSSPPWDALNKGSMQTNAQDQLYDGSQVSTKNDGLAQLQHMKEKMFILEKQPDVNANMAKDLKDMQVQVRKLVAKVKSQKDLTVSGNHQAQMQINPNANMDETQQLLQSLKMKFAQYENDLHDVQRHQEKQDGEFGKLKFENFIDKRDLSVHEAYLFIEDILSMARDGNGKNSIVVSEEGRFSLNAKDRCIGAVNRDTIFSKTKREKKLWKGRVRIKLEEEHEGVKSIMYWFDKTGLRPLYERNKKKAVHKLFAEELKDKACQPYTHLHGDRDELFDGTIPDLR